MHGHHARSQVEQVVTDYLCPINAPLGGLEPGSPLSRFGVDSPAAVAELLDDVSRHLQWECRYNPDQLPLTFGGVVNLFV